MRILVPFDAREPNTRLSSIFSPEQRRKLAELLLEDVLGAVHSAGHQPVVLATDRIDCEHPVEVDDRPLTAAVNAWLDANARPVGITMADLGLVTAGSIERLLEADGDVVIAPGLGGGTNALCVRHPGFRVDYHRGSYRKHRRAARDQGISVTTLDSFRLAVDIDEPADLVEVMLHGQGEAAEWLESEGFELDTSDGRCTVRQNES